MTMSEKVALVLRDIAVVGQVEFDMSPMYVSAFEFFAVSNAISLGYIKVTLDTNKKAQFSTYDNTKNEMVLRHKGNTSLKARAEIIHEAVHAINDLNKQPNLLKDNDEAAAYLASGMFLVRNKVQPYQAKGTLQAAMTVASLMIDAGETVVSSDKLNYILTVLRNDPLYSSQVGVTMTYDGIY